MEENKIPSEKDKVTFKDGANIGVFFKTHERTIIRWLNSDEAKKHPTASKKLIGRINAILKRREVWMNFIQLRE